MWTKKVQYQDARPVIFYLTEENGSKYLKHNFDWHCGDSRTSDCFVLPFGEYEGNASFRFTSDQPFQVSFSEDRQTVSVEAGTEASVTEYPTVPHCDIQGNRMSLEFENGGELQETAWQFYWRTLLPCVVERTQASAYPDRDGYVVSTLQKEVYAGTYPDVDHEFQVRGRIAAGGAFELELVRRMLELQLRMMAEDPEGLFRDPCAVQPDGTREYHVRRDSADCQTNAVMFLVTGNIEIIESAALYVAAAKDLDWLKRNIEGLENSLTLVEDCMDRYGRLWSDVYYEDQVIKDGRETMSAALAADAMGRMAALERLAGRPERAPHYEELKERLAAGLVNELPRGFYNGEKQRFVDWVDRSGAAHDHIHLLANELPVLFDYARDDQRKAVERLVEENFDEFQRFPTFLSARIQDYTDSEIGVPYDLCAAGRYWCWDFAYWAKLGRRDILEKQLLALCSQARLDHYLMGERYDMNYVYYISDINWHGAAHYYEYPNVYLWNLIQGYLGIRPDLEADFRIEPLLNHSGKVRMEGEHYGLEYELKDDGFRLTNLKDTARTFILCLRDGEYRVELGPGESWENQAV